MVHFQADEVPEEQRLGLQTHLDACPDCARRFEIEEVFLHGLESRLPREELPPGLETRIRATLEDATSHAAPVGWFRRPWFAAAAASVLLTLLLLGAMDGWPFRGVTDPAAVHVAQDVVVVDYDCDRGGMPLEAQRGCRHPHHINALKTPDGTYWNIAQETAGARELLLDRAMRGHRVRVEGDYYPHLHTVRLSRHQDLGLNSL